MANKSLFKTYVGKLLPQIDTRNEAGGTAYSLSPKQALAQYASTGCLNSTFYTNAETQLHEVLKIAFEVEPDFVAKAAIYARRKGYMKDLSALLCGVLSVRGKEYLPAVFPQVIDNSKMLRNYVQMVRSGVLGRKSMGSMPKRLVREWLDSRTDESLFRGAIGQSPSLPDIIKMVHPKPKSQSREALYGYLIGREVNPELLPEVVDKFEQFKKAEPGSLRTVPDVPFQMLTSLQLTKVDWMEIAKNAPWQMTRMNLNTFFRHGVFEDEGIIALVAERLKNPELIRKARVFPYQLMTAWTSVPQGMPVAIQDALQDAMEIALENVPRVDGTVYVLPDVSGSMHSSVTGYRKGATSIVRCIDVAALIAAAMLRVNPNTEVIPFESKVVSVKLNPRDSIMTNAEKLASLPMGGTNCSAPLKQLNKQRKKGDLIIYVSDNESWIDSPCHGRCGGSATQTMKEWRSFKSRNPGAQMVCIDIQPYATTQMKEQSDVFNVGGFSDQVFSMIAAIASNKADTGFWVNEIESTVVQSFN